MKFRVVRQFQSTPNSKADVYRVESVDAMTQDEADKLAEELNGEPLNRYKDVK